MVQKRHQNVFLSLSTAINGRSPNYLALIRTCAPTRLLVESDYPDAVAAPARTWDMVRIVAETRGWPIEDMWENSPPSDEAQCGIVRRLEMNWCAFVKGGHAAPAKKFTARERRRRDYSLDLIESDMEDEGEPYVSI
jgi:hypothetical protein